MSKLGMIMSKYFSVQLWHLKLSLVNHVLRSSPRNNGHATNTAVEIDGSRDGPKENEFEQDDDGKNNSLFCA